MMPNISLVWYLFVTIFAIIGFLLLAMGSKKQSLVLLNREISNKERILFKSLGWAFLVVTLFICVYFWTFSYGIFLYFGILTFTALLVIVFIGFKAYKKEPVFVEKVYKSEKKDISNKFKTLNFIAKISLVLLPLITIYSLSNTPPKSLLRADVIKDKIGELEFTLAEHDSGELEFGNNGIAFMSFNIQFCDECDMKIDDVFIKINKPLGDKNFGISFRGNYWERESTIQIPFNLNENSELYLTVIGRDKQIYQKSFNIKENFEDSYNKFVEYAKKPKLEIQW